MDHAPRFQELVLGDATMHVHTSGAGPAVFVLVHGIGVSSRYFRPLAEELSRHGTVHNVDLPGHGRSPKPPRPLSVPGYALAAWACLDALGVERPVLVGHSMGSQVAAEMARSRAAAAVVLLGPTVNPAERGFWRQAMRLGQDTLREPPEVNALVFSDYMFRCGLAWYLKTLPHMLGHHLEDVVGDLAAPVLIVRGARDPIVPRAWVDRLAALCPAARLAEVQGEAHVAMYRAAAEVAGLCLATAARA